MNGRPIAMLLVVMAVLIVTGVAVLRVGPPARANHIAGATYYGSHSGGGTMQLTLSPDGAGVTLFSAQEIPGDSCTFGDITVEFQNPAPIQDHLFDHSASVGLAFSGSFSAPGTAEGTLRAFSSAIPPYQPSCDSGTLTWTASTSGPTPAPTPTPEPTPTGEPGQLAHGDNDCDGDVDSVDGLKGLRHVASLPVAQEDGCPQIGGPVFAGTAGEIFGDVDCDGDVDSVDGLKILRYVADLEVSQTDPCPFIGDPL